MTNSITAQIIRHPTFGNQSVSQVPGQRGRPPKSMVSLHDARRVKQQRGYALSQAEEYLDLCRQRLERQMGVLDVRQEDMAKASYALVQLKRQNTGSA